MKVLAGQIAPGGGTLHVDGRPVTFAGVREAEFYGIALIHQELNLAPHLGVAANIFLGRELRRGRVLGRAPRCRSRSSRRARAEPWLPARPRRPGALADRRPAPDGRDRQGGVARGARAHHGRADRGPHRDGGGRAGRLHPQAGGGAASPSPTFRTSSTRSLALADEVTVLRDGALVATRPAAGLTAQRRRAPDGRARRVGPVPAQGPARHGRARRDVRAGRRGAGLGARRVVRPAPGRDPGLRRAGRRRADGADGGRGRAAPPQRRRHRPRRRARPHPPPARRHGGRHGVPDRGPEGPRPPGRPAAASEPDPARVAAVWAGPRGRAPGGGGPGDGRAREFDIRASRLDGPVAHLSGGNQQKLLLAKTMQVDAARADRGRADPRRGHRHQAANLPLPARPGRRGRRESFWCRPRCRR